MVNVLVEAVDGLMAQAFDEAGVVNLLAKFEHAPLNNNNSSESATSTHLNKIIRQVYGLSNDFGHGQIRMLLQIQTIL